jgi:hypothetical protein
MTQNVRLVIFFDYFMITYVFVITIVSLVITLCLFDDHICKVGDHLKTNSWSWLSIWWSEIHVAKWITKFTIVIKFRDPGSRALQDPKNILTILDCHNLSSFWMSIDWFGILLNEPEEFWNKKNNCFFH